ncbi:restriction endonuclease subunit S [Clostridium perfringens]
MNKDLKNSGVDWIKEMPKSWKVVSIKAILIERKENNNPIITDKILSLTIDKGVIPYSEKGNSGNKAKEDITAYKVAYPNDIVLNSMNIIVGAVGLSKYLGAVSPAYYTLYKRNKKDNIGYFNYVFQTKQFQNNLIGLGNGIMVKQSQSSGKLNTIRMRISMGKLNKVMIPYPTYEEQNRITTYLDYKITQIDNIIEQTHISIQEYKKFKYALITKCVTNGINMVSELVDTNVKWIGQMPKNWELKKVKYIFSIKKEIAGKVGFDILSVTQSGIKIKDISKNKGQISSDYSKYQIVEKGDFIMNHMDLLTGGVGYSEYNGVTSPDYRVFKFKNSQIYSADYYKYIMEICYKNKIFYGLGQGVANLGRWRLQTDKFLNFVLPVPPKEEQIEIVNYLDKKCAEIDNIIEQKQKLLIEMEVYKKSLIYECVTGKREVK